jgi:hypothetical protein
MAGSSPRIEWYLARDGQQHGPLSEAEMRKFVELGHLRPTDLVWRSGFPDWRPAGSVLPAVGWTQSPTRQQAPAGHGRSDSARESEISIDRDPPRKTRAGPRARRPKSVLAGRALRLLIGLAVLGGVGWAGWQYRDQLMNQTWAKEWLSWPVNAFPSSSGRFTMSPFAAAGDTAERIDENLQQTALWSLLKQEFPDWYQERITQVERLRAEKRDDAAIGKALAEAVVALRRRNARHGYAASTESLKQVAEAFVDTLTQLAKVGDNVCFGFIAIGETAAESTNYGPKQMEPLHRQVTAVFSAIAEGRRSPLAVEQVQEQDYGPLTSELRNLGWGDDEIRMFEDRGQLDKAPAGQVCKLVREWIAAHLALRDATMQRRLLIKSLQPLFAQ